MQSSKQQNYIGSMETGPNGSAGSHIHPMLHNRLGTVGGPEIQCLGHNFTISRAVAAAAMLLAAS